MLLQGQDQRLQARETSQNQRGRIAHYRSRPDQDWWTKWPHANIGICTGHTSGIVVIDVDDVTQVPSLTKLLGLEERFFLDTMTVKTGSGGYHLYFQSNLLLTKNNTGAILPGVDFIAEGGYVIAPPSVTTRASTPSLTPPRPPHPGNSSPTCKPKHASSPIKDRPRFPHPHWDFSRGLPRLVNTLNSTSPGAHWTMSGSLAWPMI